MHDLREDRSWIVETHDGSVYESCPKGCALIVSEKRTTVSPISTRMETMLTNVLKHLLTNVLPAANDYERAEIELSHAFARNADPSTWEREGQQAKRRAAEVAIAIDGLADRAASVLGLAAEQVRQQVASRCIVGDVKRDGCIERVCAVANAYKHSGPLNAKHPITSESDVLATGAGFGIDGFRVGKFSGIEVLVNQKDGTVRKFLGDVPWSIAGWFNFLADQATRLPSEEFLVCGLVVNGKASAAPVSGP
jgi:hypothetical protein